MRAIAVFVENRPFFGALLVHAPLLHALRERNAGTRLVLYAPFPQARLLVDAGAADEVVVYRGGFARAFVALRHALPDEVLMLRPASRGLDVAVAAARVPVSIGFESWLGRLLYTRTVPHDTGIYRPRKYLTLVMSRDEALSAPLDEWFRPLAARVTSSRTIGAHTLAVLPGGGAGDFKRWGAERFLALCARLAAEDAALRFAWVLGPQEAAWRERIAASALADRSDVLFDRPLGELAAAAYACRAAVGNDCGPGHVFQMCGCPFACVLSDHDGEGAIRAAEWLDAANRPFATIGARGMPIGDIAAEPVLERVRAALAAKRVPN